MKITNIFNGILYKQKLDEFFLKQREKKRNKALKKLPLIDYFTFENEFRGSKNLISERQKPVSYTFPMNNI